MPLVSMKRKKSDSDSDLDINDNEFPWGLQIHLHEDELEKLGIKELPEVGGEISLEAKVTVTSASINETKDNGVDRSITLQITELGLFEKEKSASDSLYGAAFPKGK